MTSKQRDLTALEFIRDRLIHVHGEKPNVDYMVALNRVINNTWVECPRNHIFTRYDQVRVNGLITSVEIVKENGFTTSCNFITIDNDDFADFVTSSQEGWDEFVEIRKGDL